MANIVEFTCCILLSIVISFTISQEYVDGLKDEEPAKHPRYRNTPVVKTFTSLNGDVVDCVDINKQPSLNHPLLRNHTIQKVPSSWLNEMKPNSSTIKFFNPYWSKHGKCPKGTIPILRNQADNVYKTHFPDNLTNVDRPPQEYAAVHLFAQNEPTYHGASALVNLWNPTVEGPGEFSSAQIWVSAGQLEALNSVAAGWMVHPNMYKDTKTRLFLFWTADGYQTGCYNQLCDGFVHVDNRFPIGGEIKPLSTYNGQQYESLYSIKRNADTGDWWIQLHTFLIGYWPASLFTTLKGPADKVSWGGVIVNANMNGRHTSTQMGSGHFPIEAGKKAAFFRSLQVMDAPAHYVAPDRLTQSARKSGCYDLYISPDRTFFYYGGPGWSPQCP